LYPCEGKIGRTYPHCYERRRTPGES
jgi:hypothetical protein